MEPSNVIDAMVAAGVGLRPIKGPPHNHPLAVDVAMEADAKYGEPSDDEYDSEDGDDLPDLREMDEEYFNEEEAKSKIMGTFRGELLAEPQRIIGGNMWLPKVPARDSRSKDPPMNDQIILVLAMHAAAEEDRASNPEPEINNPMTFQRHIQQRHSSNYKPIELVQPPPRYSTLSFVAGPLILPACDRRPSTNLSLTTPTKLVVEHNGTYSFYAHKRKTNISPCNGNPHQDSALNDAELNAALAENVRKALSLASFLDAETVMITDCKGNQRQVHGEDALDVMEGVIKELEGTLMVIQKRIEKQGHRPTWNRFEMFRQNLEWAAQPEFVACNALYEAYAFVKCYFETKRYLRCAAIIRASVSMVILGYMLWFWGRQTWCSVIMLVVLALMADIGAEFLAGKLAGFTISKKFKKRIRKVGRRMLAVIMLSTLVGGKRQ